MPLAEIGSLWIGRRLSFLERLCLKSFADAGHPVTLYTYEALEDPPDYCEIRDAREVWADDDVLVHEGKSSPAIHSDVFRIKMLRATDKIWVDTDAYCVKPFAPKDGYLFGYQYRKSINNGVLRLPKTSPALVAFDEFLSTRGAWPPWWSDADRAAYAAEHGEPDFQKMQWGTTGPIGLTWFLTQSGEDSHALPAHALYPLPQNRKGLPFRPARHGEAFLKDDTVSLHFYGSWLRGRLAERTVAPGSLLGVLGAKHGIAPDGAPAAGGAQLATGSPMRAEPGAAGFPAERKRRAALALAFIFDLLELSARPSRPKYVQVGANDGKLADPLFKRTASGAFSALLLEPSPDYFAALSDRYAGRDDVETVNLGVSSAAGSLPLYQLSRAYEGDFPEWARGCASLNRNEIVKVLSRVRPVEDAMIEATEVRLDRLDVILRDHGAEDADLLVVDVEGHEPHVFASFEFGAFAPKAVLFEHANLDEAGRAAVEGKLFAADYRLFALRNDTLAVRREWAPASIVLALVELGLVERRNTHPKG